MDGKQRGYPYHAVDETEDALDDRATPAQDLGRDGRSRYSRETNPTMDSNRPIARPGRVDDLPEYMTRGYPCPVVCSGPEDDPMAPGHGQVDVDEGAAFIERLAGDMKDY